MKLSLCWSRGNFSLVLFNLVIFFQIRNAFARIPDVTEKSANTGSVVVLGARMNMEMFLLVSNALVNQVQFLQCIICPHFISFHNFDCVQNLSPTP